MSDPRLEILGVPKVAYDVDSIRITRLKIKGYRFFAAPIELSIDGKNLLLYGENGTGKSSIYRALGLLVGKNIDKISGERNVFSPEEMPEIEFAFTNSKTLTFDSDSTEIPLGFEYLKPLALFVPLLDYKRLLRIHFSSIGEGERINIYSMLRDLFGMYPVGDKGTKLSEIRNFPDYFSAFESLMNRELLPKINDFISVFDKDFSIDKFDFTTEIDESGRPEPRISILIDYRETLIEHYHSFLNEARLSALAISLYFASIRRILEKTAAAPCKILVLDDLLISLDMGNRNKLIEILKTSFNDFQVFFFTHDKNLFDLYRDKMDWACYELYLEDSGLIPTVFITTGKTEVESAKKSFSEKDYPACAVHLRTGFEKLLKNSLSPSEQRNKKCEALNLSGLISRMIAKSEGEVKNLLERLDSDRTHILNPLCHADGRNLYSQELKTAIGDLEKLTEFLRH